MLSAALCAGAISVTTAAPARASEPSSARFRAPADAQQLVVVSSPSYQPPDYLATLRTYERDGPIDAWREVLSPSQAETGYGHLRDQRHEGDGSTPTGVFGFGQVPESVFVNSKGVVERVYYGAIPKQELARGIKMLKLTHT